MEIKQDLKETAAGLRVDSVGKLQMVVVEGQEVAVGNVVCTAQTALRKYSLTR